MTDLPTLSQRPFFRRLFLTGARGTVASLLLPKLRCTLPLCLSDVLAGDVDGLPVEAVDLLDFSALLQAMQGCDVVLHLAIASGRQFPDRTAAPDALSAFDAATLEVNTTGSYHLFEAARRAGVRRVILMSSLTLLQGYPTAGERAQPGLSPRPAKLYAVTKWFGEEIGALYHRQFGLEVMILRLGQPYPLGTHHDREVLATAEGRQLAVHRDDLCAGVLAALATPVTHGVFNLVSRGEPYSLDLSPGARMGYTPAYVFRESGPERMVG